MHKSCFLFAFAVSVVSGAAQSQAAPIVSFLGGVTSTGNEVYVIHVDPFDTVFDTIDLQVTTTTGFVNTETNPFVILFSPPGVADDTDVLGLGTVTLGWNVLGSADNANTFAASGGLLGSTITAPVDFAQVVFPPGGSQAEMRISYAFAGEVVHSQSSFFTPDYDPPIINDAEITVESGSLATHQFTFGGDYASRGTESWEIQSLTGGTAPNAPGISLDGEFSWDTTGADGPGSIYTALVIATNTEGYTGLGMLTITIVPEPATMALAGLSLIGVFASRRRS